MVTLPPTSVGSPESTTVPVPERPGVGDTLGADGDAEEQVVNVPTLLLAAL